MNPLARLVWRMCKIAARPAGIAANCARSTSCV